MDDATGDGRADRRLRVGVDGFNLAMRRGTGVATYARALSHCIASLGHDIEILYGLDIPPRAVPALREILFFDGLDQERERKPPGVLSRRWLQELARAPLGFDAIEVPITGRVEMRGLAGRLPRYDRLFNVRDLFPMAARYFRRTRRFLEIRIAGGLDIMHWTYPLPIRVAGARNVYTVHDVVPLRLPYTTLDNKRYHYRLLAGCARYGSHLCTVSEVSRRDFLEFFPQAAGRISNTYESIVIPERETGEDDVPGLFGLQPREYFLFFGSIEPKKNVGRLVEAYLTSGVSAPLVIVGAQAWKSEAELRMIKDHGDAIGVGRIRQVDYLPAVLLQGLLRNARAMLFPSLYEGFGLPVLEAMAAGTPVLTSREGSLPEIAGDCALFADAYETGSIAEGIRRLDRDAALRTELVARGHDQARLFDMARYRVRVDDMYQAIMRAPAATRAGAHP